MFKDRPTVSSVVFSSLFIITFDLASCTEMNCFVQIFPLFQKILGNEVKIMFHEDI